MIQQRHVDECKRQLIRAGWACDIDNTVSATAEAFFDRMDGLFPRPEGDEGLSVSELVRKYVSDDQVPTWQTPEARAASKAIISDPEFYRELPPIAGSDTVLRRFTEALPFTCFITARPNVVADETRAWLESRFPTLPLITKPDSVDPSRNNEWKARLLEALYPQVRGIVDDDPRLVEHLSPGYGGTVIIFGASSVEHDHVEAYACLTWKDVERKLEELASLKAASI